MKKLIIELELLRSYLGNEIMNKGNNDLIKDFVSVYLVLDHLYTLSPKLHIYIGE